MIWLLAAAALAGATAQDDAQANLKELQQVFQDSCAQRAYGAYDDMCDQLRRQVHAAEVAADRAAREARRKASRSADPAAAGTAAPAPPPAAPPQPLGYKPPPHPQA